ncbi:MAG TPA: YihY/virulence factor BrkB family protein, partial [Beijerinckiaceae bacterium]
MAAASTGSRRDASGFLNVLMGLGLARLVAAARREPTRPAAARRARPAEGRPTRHEKGEAQIGTEAGAGSHEGRDAERVAQEQPDRGRQAASPSEIPAKGWKDILWRVYQEIGKDRIVAVAAGVTFYGLLALFPAIAAMVSLYGLFADPGTINEHLATVSGLLPGGAMDIISEQVKRIASKGGGTLGFTFFIGLAISLWSANAGMKAVFDALNVAYGEEEKRSFVMLNLQSLTFTFAMIAFLLLAIGGIVVIPVILKFLWLGKIEWLISFLRWPVLYAGVLFALACLYRYGPSRDKPQWRWVTWGSAIAGAVWLVGSMLFSWYVANFGN